MIRPGSEGAGKGAKHQSGKDENGGDERAGPASAQIGELRNRLSEKYLISIALKVAQHRGAKDSRDDDDSEERRADIIEGVRIRGIEQDFAIAEADRSKTFRCDAKKSKSEPDREIYPSRNAFCAEL